MKKKQCCLVLILILCLMPGLHAQQPGFEDHSVGTKPDGSLGTVDGKLIHAAGDSIPVIEKLVDIILAPDGSLLFTKSWRGITVIDTKTFKVVQTITQKDVSGSSHGIAVMPAESGKGWTVYFTLTAKSMLEAHVDVDGKAKWGRMIPLGGPHNWGIGLSPDGRFAYVCMSVKNTLGIVDLAQGKVIREIPVGVSPYDVAISPDGKIAYVTNLGGGHPKPGQPTEKSVGTNVAVDNRSIPLSGTVSKVDLQSGVELNEIKTGLHPTQIIRDAKGTRYFVANANSDSVSVIDARMNQVQTIAVRPDPQLLFGSIPDALALSPDEKTLYVANAGNNALAVVPVDQSKESKNRPAGFIPSGWFPSGVVCDGTYLYIANAKSGTVERVRVADGQQLKSLTAEVMSEEHVPQQLREMERAKSGVPPVPVPVHPGEPSVFRHVVYILRENKTYDQLLGDIGRGNSDPKLCIYGQTITPNLHAMAQQFALLDNYYCNSGNSSSGHQWATQGIITEYFEKGSRTYDFGTDALCYANCDFIWDSCLLHGLSVRNYGEFDFPSVTSKPRTWFDVYQGWDKGLVTFQQSVQFNTLMDYTCKQYPGWNLTIPDVSRTKVFLKELAGFEQSGNLPDFLFVYLPQDHTAGTGKTWPAPKAMVADNDLATGQVVEAISKSRFWKDTCIFINEDDPQSGSDHVDGHRSICLVVSPYTKRESIVSDFYNQSSVLRTMTQMLGVPPMNQACAVAPTMEDCFTNKPDLRPFQCVANQVPLDLHNPSRQAMNTPERNLNDAVAQMDLSRPDRLDDDKFNRLLWLASGSKSPYPAEFAGPHGRGLKALHLTREQVDGQGDSDGDDDGD